MPQLRACALLLALAATSLWSGAGAIRKRRVATAEKGVEATQVSSDRVAGRRRRRRTCGAITDFPTNRADTVGCSSAVIGACEAPKYYTIVRDANARVVNLGTYSSRAPAQAVYDQGGQVTVLLDETQTVVTRRDNCGRSGEFQEWAVDELTTVHYCDYPNSKWDLVFSVNGSGSIYERNVTTTIGRSFTQNTTLTHQYQFGSSVGWGPFKSSSKYTQIWEYASSETWSYSYTISEKFTAPAGVSLSKWKFAFIAKCFNREGQFLDEVKFNSNIYCDTDTDTRPPDDALECPGLVAAVGDDFVPLQSFKAGSD